MFNYKIIHLFSLAEMKNKIAFFGVVIFLALGVAGCYSFTGASIDGKTINVHPFENRAYNVVPTLATALNEKIRNRIISQTGLAPVNNDEADYDIQGVISGYNVMPSGAANSSSVATNRLTITIEITFKNRKDDKQSFKQSFSRFSDFDGNQQLQSVEGGLIDDIGSQLAEDIFNKAFVNW